MVFVVGERWSTYVKIIIIRIDQMHVGLIQITEMGKYYYHSASILNLV